MPSPDNTQNPPLKRCTKCGCEYPATTEYFFRQSRGLYGLRSDCKNCHAKSKGLKGARYWPPILVLDGYKQCSKCNIARPATREYFNADRRASDGLQSQCRNCDKAAGKIYYQNHREQIIARSVQWQKDNARRNNAYNRQRYQKNIKKQREYNRIKRQRLYKENPDNQKRAAKIHFHRRKAQKNSLPSTFTTRDWKHALAYFNGCCAVCGRPRGLWHTLAVDHWIPLADTDHCPGTVPANIIPLCHGIDGCNNSKGASDPVEWLTARFGARKAKQILKRIEAYFASLKDDDS